MESAITFPYILKAKDQAKSFWSGGSSRQLFIYPAGATYAQRNFQCRISTASTEIETSTFTPLPGIQRHILVLDGAFRLEHEQHYSKELKKGEGDVFAGDWKTNCRGQATDFNLMLGTGLNGKLVYREIPEGHSVIIDAKDCFFGCYIYKGAANITINKNSIDLEKHDFVLLKLNREQCYFRATTNCEVVMLEVSGLNTIIHSEQEHE